MDLQSIIEHIGRHRKLYIGIAAFVALRAVREESPKFSNIHPTEFKLTDDLLDFLHMKGLDSEFKAYHQKADKRK